MKQLLKTFYVLLALCFMCVSVQAQSYLKKYNSDITIGLMGGNVNYGKEYHQFTFGFDMSICGFYFDIGGNPRSHDNDSKNGKFGSSDDEYNFFIHAGYQIPLGKVLKVAPIIGYYYHSLGESHTETYQTIDRNTGEVKTYVRNKYEGDERHKDFDYGVQVQLNLPISKSFWLAPQVIYTKNMWTVGLAAVIPF